jgi:Ca2+-binding RTX toxin-like protein
VNYSVGGSGVSVNLALGTSTGEGVDAITAVENVRGTTHRDELTGSAGPNGLYGGSGADTILGLGGDDILGTEGCCDDESFLLDGGPGNDRLVADGVGTLDGGDGDDALSATADGSTLDGGPGVDTADYRSVIDWDLPRAGVFADMEIDLQAGVARPRDCQPGCPGDALIAVEAATTGAGDDLLTGDLAANVLIGGFGDDDIAGGDGDDRLVGGDEGVEGDEGDGGTGADTCISIEDSVNCEQ